jgi:hypothetical protein
MKAQCRSGPRYLLDEEPDEDEDEDVDDCAGWE